MHLRARAILVSARPHGETAAIARMLTEDFGLVAGYVAGGRGRQLRPVLIPGNLVELELRALSDSQLPFARLELRESRGPWIGEPLPAAAIGWTCALAATVLPERNPYPSLYSALSATLDAVCHAPSARGWLRAVIAYEALVLRELGYGGDQPGGPFGGEAELEALLEIFAGHAALLERYLLADRRGDVMAARTMLGERLERIRT